MSEAFAHIAVLISILVGFGISQVLSSWGRLIRRREQVQVYWLHLFWMFLILLVLVQMWWGTWDMRQIERWGFLDMGLLLSEFFAPILAIFVISPHVDEESGLDLREYYWRNQRWFFLLAALSLVLMTFANLLLVRIALFSAENVVRFVAFLLVLGLAFSRSERVHVAALTVACILLILFILFTYAVLS